MTLEEKLLKINEPKIPLLSVGEADTIDDFFNNFVKPLFPDENIVRAWHRILMEYTDDLSNLSCCVRYGNNGSKNESCWGEKEYFKLRRGWLTQNDIDNFEYFFADNFFSAFIYKMAMDGFVPKDVAELRSIFRKHQFPYGFGFKVDKKINEYKGVVIKEGKEPGFLNNYKLSHVFDAGEYFFMDDGCVYGDAELSLKHYPIGHSNDFLKNPNKIRKMHISDQSKKVIVAKFLRFAHPLNYFLTPAKKLHSTAIKVHMNDIGESPIMIQYVKQYLEKTYPIEYKEFIDRIMWKENYIGIKWWPKKSKSSAAKSPKKSKPHSAAGTPGTTVFYSLSSAYRTSVRKIMREMGISDLKELESRIDEAIDYCTKEKEVAKKSGDSKKVKHYNDCRSAIRKYKDFLKIKESSI